MAKLSNLASVGELARAITDEPDVYRGFEMLLKATTTLFAADHGAIYKLHLDRSEYVLELAYVVEQRRFIQNTPRFNVPLDKIANQEFTGISLIRKSITTRQIVTGNPQLIDQLSYVQDHISSTVLIPILRGTSCLGVLRLDSADKGFAETINPYDVEFVRALILSLFERQSSLCLLKAMQRPIDFLQPLEDFIDNILLVVAEAAQVPYIQIHELESDRQLRCIAVYGFRGEMYELDLQPVEAFTPFANALARSIAVVEPMTDAPHLTTMNQLTAFQEIRSFVVVPVVVGTQIFGTVLFGAACPFDYSTLEIAGFESLASTIGAAIANSRSTHQLRDLFIADARLGVAISGIEVAQAARHEVRGIVDDCIASLATVQSHLRRNKVSDAEQTLHQVGRHLSTISIAIDKIKHASRAPDDSLQSVSLVEIWQQARTLVSARLEHEHIQTRITSLGEQIQIEVLPDSLRHAFLHLLLNSIDAFKAKHKGDRLITISIDSHSDAALDVRIRYTDNAGGIDPAEFRQWTDADPSRDLKQLIFEKGVTTKTSGSGYGLYLVRTILARHNGSIDLLHYREGVVFDITLPKHLRTKIEPRQL